MGKIRYLDEEDDFDSKGRKKAKKTKKTNKANSLTLVELISFFKLFKPLLTSKVVLAIIGIAVAAFVVLFCLKDCSTKNGITIGTDDTIDETPQVITAMKAIGQWEFLAISDEELVDTVRKGIISDDELVRIYYGTVRLGVDMSKLKDDAIETKGDSMTVAVPRIQLLDSNFIDEALTKSFFEKGKWSDKDKEKLYKKAHRMMKARCLTKANVKKAQDIGRQQFDNFFRSLGYKHVAIVYE